jgi:spermidine synthase
MVVLISLVFLVSGAAGLVFEALWFHQAGLVFGNSVWGAALVLASFMGGLALGNGIAAAYGARVTRPLRTYAILEAVVGLTGFSLVLFFPFLQGHLVPVFRASMDLPWLLNLNRLGIAFVLMLLPTTAMGATLPILVKALSQLRPGFGWALGRLYGWNTLGAVLGVVAAETVLIPQLGIKGAGLFAALLNMSAMGVSLWLATRSHRPAADPDGTVPRMRIPGPARRLLLAAFISGGIMLSLEVVWFRFLLLVQNGTSLVFAVMLAVVLAGIGTGGLLAAWWCRRSDHAHRHLRPLSLLSGVLVVLTYRAFSWFLPASESGGQELILGLVLPASWLMLPAAVLSGVLFTMLGRAAKDGIRTGTGTAGLLALMNTVGGAMGSLVAGFILLPELGMERSFFVLAAAYGVMALLIPGRAGARPGRVPILSYAALGVFALSLWLFPFGLMNDAYFSRPSARFGAELVGLREGLTETSFYLRYERFGEPYSYKLVTNSHTMAGTSVRSRRYMKLYVYWPVAVHPDPQHALLISYGVGSTAKALTDTKTLKTIDIVEISQDILDMSWIVYPDPADHPLHDERVRLHIEDGRFFLNNTEKRFDLISGEPPPPKHAGIVNLYSQEYFELLHDRLAPGGMVTYWLPVHALREEESKSIIKAFCNAFEDCSLWTGAGLDWMLVGARDPRGTVSREHFSRQWRDPVVAEELRATGLERPAQLGALFIADAADLENLTRSSLPLTDDFPRRVSPEEIWEVEHSPVLAALMDPRGARERFLRSDLIRRLWPRALMDESLEYFDYQRMINGFFDPSFTRGPSNEWDDFHRVLSKTSLKTLPLWLMGSTQKEQEIAEGLAEKQVDGEDLHHVLAKRLLAERDYPGAAVQLETQLRSRSGGDPSAVLPLYLFTLCMGGEREKAGQVAQTLAPSASRDPAAGRYWSWMRSFCDLRVPGGTRKPIMRHQSR